MRDSCLVLIAWALILIWFQSCELTNAVGRIDTSVECQCDCNCD